MENVIGMIFLYYSPFLSSFISVFGLKFLPVFLETHLPCTFILFSSSKYQGKLGMRDAHARLDMTWGLGWLNGMVCLLAG